MGDSRPPQSSFDLIGSYARCRGTDVEIVLGSPEFPVEPGSTLTLRKGRRSARGGVEQIDGPDGRRLRCRVPRAELADGRWSLLLGTDTPERLNARLLVQGKRPVVLLWGANNPTSLVAGPAAPAPSKQAARAAARALDRALVTLPPARARAVRTRVRSAARSILG